MGGDTNWGYEKEETGADTGGSVSMSRPSVSGGRCHLCLGGGVICVWGEVGKSQRGVKNQLLQPHDQGLKEPLRS